MTCPSFAYCSLQLSPSLTFLIPFCLQLTQVLRQCPGLTCAYVELARCYAGLGMFDEAARALQQCITLQPNNSPVLVAVSTSPFMTIYCRCVTRHCITICGS